MTQSGPAGPSMGLFRWRSIPRIIRPAMPFAPWNKSPADLRSWLLWRIGRHYDTITEPVTFGPRSLYFTRIADPNRVLDEVAEEEDRREKVSGNRHEGDQLQLPYWAELWDSALGICTHLLDLPVSPKSQVMDLGCGMGLTGCVAAMLGHHVQFADLETPALLFARLNSIPWRSRITTRKTNWRTDRLDRKFNLIIGADILYERAQWDHLHRFWLHHLDASGMILLGEPGRQTGDLFIPWATNHGWRIQQFSQPVTTRPKPIRLLRMYPPDAPPQTLGQ